MAYSLVYAVVDVVKRNDVLFPIVTYCFKTGVFPLDRFFSPEQISNLKILDYPVSLGDEIYLFSLLQPSDFYGIPMSLEF